MTDVPSVRSDLFVASARVWVPDKHTVWRPGVLLAPLSHDGVLSISLEGIKNVETFNASSDDHVDSLSGTTRSINLLNKDGVQQVFLRNPDLLQESNDLTSLSHLHEAAVLNNLCGRYLQKKIYTYCGIVLVAINPFEYLPLYTDEIIESHNGTNRDALPPHVFAVAEESLYQMKIQDRNQIIIVSGESGAGKTVSAKFVMRYFAQTAGGDESHVERKVLASNPIMEAFGNAKTLRNDNSSRFGKFVEINFDRSGHIMGASMRTYLLEKTRVVFQAEGERSYHIFYQICAARDHDVVRKFSLGPSTDYLSISGGRCPVVASINDESDFEKTWSALEMVLVRDVDRDMLLAILVALLHLGNIEITAGSARLADSRIDNDEKLQISAKALEVDAVLLSKWICNRKIVTGRETFIKPHTQSDAVAARDAISKHIYSRLFNWLVIQINSSMSGDDRHSFIGVLDIYGFETFKFNSFEQFCINYANEKLQQVFNRHIFKLEQEEYMREEIDWRLVEFYDNQPCLDLIESKLGIMAMLDEECRMPKGGDLTFTQKLYTTQTENPHFVKPRMDCNAFIVKHYAMDVQYASAGFLEKNKDTISDELSLLLSDSGIPLLADLFEPNSLFDTSVNNRGTLKAGNGGCVNRYSSMRPRSNSIGGNVGGKITVGAQFKDSLNILMDTINDTTPHFIRCIKPNQEKAFGVYDRTDIVEQLRACGVLETIRISAAGFPSRWSYSEMIQRYAMLLPESTILPSAGISELRAVTELIMKTYVNQSEKYKFGKTKIFFRAGQVALLEKLRNDKLGESAVMIQKTFRMYYQRRNFFRMRMAAVRIQAHTRQFLAKLLLVRLKLSRAATLLQRCWRMAYTRRRFLRIHIMAVGMQARIRGNIARLKFRDLKRWTAAETIQCAFRGYQERTRYHRALRCIVIVQSLVRRWNARKQLRILRSEARSIAGIQKQKAAIEEQLRSQKDQMKQLLLENSDKAKKLQSENEILHKKLKASDDKCQSFERELIGAQEMLAHSVSEEVKQELLKEAEENAHRDLTFVCGQHLDLLSTLLEGYVDRPPTLSELFKANAQQLKHVFFDMLSVFTKMEVGTDRNNRLQDLSVAVVIASSQLVNNATETIRRFQTRNSLQEFQEACNELLSDISVVIRGAPIDNCGNCGGDDSGIHNFNNSCTTLHLLKKPLEQVKEEIRKVQMSILELVRLGGELLFGDDEDGEDPVFEDLEFEEDLFIGLSGGGNAPADIIGSRDKSNGIVSNDEDITAALFARRPSDEVKTFTVALAHEPDHTVQIAVTSEDHKSVHARIAESFGVRGGYETIAFCTLNESEYNESSLLGDRLLIGDFIFAHMRSNELRTVSFVKSKERIGLRLGDNGAGTVFVKSISTSGIAVSIKGIHPGDCIDAIGTTICDVSVGMSHKDVLGILKAVPVGDTVILHLSTPLKYVEKHPEPTEIDEKTSSIIEKKLNKEASIVVVDTMGFHNENVPLNALDKEAQEVEFEKKAMRRRAEREAETARLRNARDAEEQRQRDEAHAAIAAVGKVDKDKKKLSNKDDTTVQRKKKKSLFGSKIG